MSHVAKKPLILTVVLGVVVNRYRSITAGREPQHSVGWSTFDDNTLFNVDRPRCTSFGKFLTGNHISGMLPYLSRTSPGPPDLLSMRTGAQLLPQTDTIQQRVSWFVIGDRCNLVV